MRMMKCFTELLADTFPALPSNILIEFCILINYTHDKLHP